jgi:hypothetical protein
LGFFASALIGVFGHGQEALETLALQVFKGGLFLSWFADYDKPVWLSWFHGAPVLFWVLVEISSSYVNDFILCSVFEQMICWVVDFVVGAGLWG